MSVVAVDAGRSNCRAALFADGSEVPGPVATVPSEATLADPDGAGRVAGTVTAALGALGCWEQEPPSALVVAAAGSLSRRDAAAALARQLAGALLAPARWGLSSGGIDRVLVTSDVVAAHAGAFQGAPGVVLAVGTGAVAFTMAPGRRHTVVDGAGYLFGDAGSGFAIGRAGLAAALRHADGRAGGSAVLAAAATARFAPPGGTLREVAAALYGGSDPTRRVARVASFATAVAEAARGGDPVAVAIWAEAAAELAETVLAACAPLPPEHRRVALVGSLAEVEDLLVAPLRARLAERAGEVCVRTGESDCLAGAARLAHHPAGGYEPLLLACPVGAPAGAGHAPAGGPGPAGGGGSRNLC